MCENLMNIDLSKKEVPAMKSMNSTGQWHRETIDHIKCGNQAKLLPVSRHSYLLTIRNLNK